MSLESIDTIVNSIKITPKLIQDLNNLSLPKIKLSNEIEENYKHKIIEKEIKELNKIYKKFIKVYKVFNDDEVLTFEILKNREEIYNKVQEIKFLHINCYKQINEEIYKKLLFNLLNDKLIKKELYDQYIELFSVKTFLEIDKIKANRKTDDFIILLENSSLAFDLWYKNIFHCKVLKSRLDNLMKKTFSEEMPNIDYEDFEDFYNYTLSLILNGANIDKQEIGILKTFINLKHDLWVDKNGELF